MRKGIVLLLLAAALASTAPAQATGEGPLCTADTEAELQEWWPRGSLGLPLGARKRNCEKKTGADCIRCCWRKHGSCVTLNYLWEYVCPETQISNDPCRYGCEPTRGGAKPPDYTPERPWLDNECDWRLVSPDTIVDEDCLKGRLECEEACAPSDE